MRDLRQNDLYFETDGVYLNMCILAKTSNKIGVCFNICISLSY